VLASCGNGILDPGEECEDGDDDPGDGCTTSCTFPVCGDGFVWLGHEDCDDGNPIETDDCTTACELAACGDGIVQAGEDCDDGNLVANDGCSAQCIEQRVVQIGVGPISTCVRTAEGAIRCWGDGAHGKLGYANVNRIGDDEHPWTAGDVDIGGPALALSVGSGHSCVLLDQGKVRCWGENYDGQLGYGHTENIGDDETPSSAGDVDVGGSVVQVVAGGARTCAVLDTGAVRCWGSATEGLGYANTQNIGDNETPASAGDIDLGAEASQVASDLHTCSISTNNGVSCWGYNGWGQLGYPFLEIIGDDETPASVGFVNLGPGTVQSIAVAGQKTCVIMGGGAVRCWGWAASNLGYPDYPFNIGDDEDPAVVGDIDLAAPVEALSLGEYHTCVLLEGHTVRCWGANWFGLLGAGDPWYQNDVPAAALDIELGDPIAAIASNRTSNCALTESGGVRCWGNGAEGNLGYANTNHIGDDEWPVFAGYVQVFQP